MATKFIAFQASLLDLSMSFVNFMSVVLMWEDVDELTADELILGAAVFCVLYAADFYSHCKMYKNILQDTSHTTSRKSPALTDVALERHSDHEPLLDATLRTTRIKRSNRGIASDLGDPFSGENDFISDLLGAKGGSGRKEDLYHTADLKSRANNTQREGFLAISCAVWCSFDGVGVPNAVISILFGEGIVDSSESYRNYARYITIFLFAVSLLTFFEKVKFADTYLSGAGVTEEAPNKNNYCLDCLDCFNSILTNTRKSRVLCAAIQEFCITSFPIALDSLSVISSIWNDFDSFDQDNGRPVFISVLALSAALGIFCARVKYNLLMNVHRGDGEKRVASKVESALYAFSKLFQQAFVFNLGSEILKVPKLKFVPEACFVFFCPTAKVRWLMASKPPPSGSSCKCCG